MPISDIQFQDLRDKVNSVSQTQDEKVLPALDQITKKLDNLAFVSQKDFDIGIKNLQKQIDDNKKTLDEVVTTTSQGGLKLANALSGSAFKGIVVLLIFGALALVVWGAIKLYPALGGHS